MRESELGLNNSPPGRSSFEFGSTTPERKLDPRNESDELHRKALHSPRTLASSLCAELEGRDSPRGTASTRLGRDRAPIKAWDSDLTVSRVTDRMAHRHQLPSFYPPTYSASPAPPWGQQQQQQQQPPQQSTSAGAGYAQSDSDYALPPPGLPVDPASNNNNHFGGDDDQYSDSPGPNTRGSAAGGAGNGADDASEGLDGQGGEKKKPTRGARACLHCRRLKVSLSPSSLSLSLAHARPRNALTHTFKLWPCPADEVHRSRERTSVQTMQARRPRGQSFGANLASATKLMTLRPAPTTRSASLRRVSVASGATAKPMQW